MEINKNIQLLLDKGVTIPAPFSIEINDDVNIDRISSDGVVIHSGCKISGSDTLISKGSVIGQEGPVTIENCFIGPDVQLKGGFFKKSVFLKKSSAGLGAHVREGTILEEEANIAHTVGLKQTILFPFVTLGSLINFCDCFMAGGTSRKNHSEVGSSYIHFNYTPNQDKATASLIGDVPNGVMLNNNPIFLGGQGGLVGPCMFNYGTVIAAGTIQRKDELEPDRLLFGGAMKRGRVKAPAGIYQNVKRIVGHNIIYLGNLIALLNWYENVRVRFISEEFSKELFSGLKATLNIAIDERVKRMKALNDKFSFSMFQMLQNGKTETPLTKQKKEYIENWFFVEEKIRELQTPATALCKKTGDSFLTMLDTAISENGNSDYIKLIQGLNDNALFTGTLWLSEIVEHFNDEIFQILPSFKS